MNNKAFTVAAIVFVYLLVFVQYESYLRKTTNTIHEETHQPTESCPNFGPRWSMVVTEKTKIPGESYPFIPYKIHEPVVQYNPETPIEIYNAYKNWDAWRVNASEFITISKLSNLIYLFRPSYPCGRCEAIRTCQQYLPFRSKSTLLNKKSIQYLSSQ